LDLQQVYLESARTFGEQQAEKYLRGILDTFAHLLAFPLSSNIRAEYRGSIRVWHYESHQIAYRLKRNELLIVRIVHSRRDLKRHL
jgi:toxin ParE1/3/4